MKADGRLKWSAHLNNSVSAQYRDNFLSSSNKCISIGCGDVDPTLGLNFPDKGLEGVYRGDIVVLVEIVKDLNRRIKFWIKAFFNTLLQIQSDHIVNNSLDLLLWSGKSERGYRHPGSR